MPRPNTSGGGAFAPSLHAKVLWRLESQKPYHLTDRVLRSVSLRIFWIVRMLDRFYDGSRRFLYTLKRARSLLSRWTQDRSARRKGR